MKTSKTGSSKKATHLASLNLLFVVCFVFSIKEYTHASGTVRPEVDKLISQLHSDFSTPEDEAKLAHDLSTRPDIKPDLFAALDRDYFHGVNDGRLGHVDAVAALIFRKDLTPGELKIITGELNELAGNKDGRSRNNESFIGPGILVLKNYPAKENEELVLKFTDDKAVGWDILADTLGMIGTEISHTSLLEWRDKLRAENPKYTILKNIDEAIIKIEKRMNAQKVGAGKPTSEAVTVPNHTLKDLTKNGNEDTNRKPTPSLIPWLVAGASIAILVLVILFQRKAR